MIDAGQLWRAGVKEAVGWDRKAGTPLLRWGLALSILEAVLGQVLSLVALCYLEGPTAVLGVLLGICVTMSGCLGVSGCVFRDVGQLVGHTVGALLCACLAFGYISQVGSHARFDCAMAQLRLMDQQSQASLQRIAQSRQHLMTAVRLRLDAVGSTLDLLSSDPQLVLSAVSPPPPGGSLPPATQDLELQGQRNKRLGGGNTLPSEQVAGAKQELVKAHAREVWRATDAHYVDRKLKELKDHSTKVLNQLFNQTREGKLKELKEAVEGSLTEGDRKEMEDRFYALFGAVAEALHQATRHLDGDATLSPSEYELLLNDLETAMGSASAYIREMEQVLGDRGGSPISHAEFQRLMHAHDSDAPPPAPAKPLQGMREELALVKQALGRQQREQGYETMHIPDAHKAKAGWRQQWDKMLEAAVAAEEEGDGAMEHSLQKCVEELSGERLLVRAAMALVAVQACCIYVVWQAAVHQAQRRDHWE